MSKHNNAEEAVSDNRQKGSFEVFSNNQPATQPIPPIAAGDKVAPQYYHLEHQAAPQEESLPCGIGIGWILFILGFFLGLPWYIGAILSCFKMDRREKPGLVACAIAAVVYTFLVIIVIIVRHNTYA